MPRIQPNNNPAPEAEEMLKAVEQKIGSRPNIFKTFANSPAVLDFYLSGSKALGGTALSAAQREQIALVVAGANHCDYCASAHTAIAKGAGVSEDEAAHNLNGKASDDKTQAMLTFSRKMVDARGNLNDADVQVVRDAGFSEGEIVEMIAVVCVNIFTNYFNHICDTEVDFPFVSTADVAKAA